MNLLPLCLLYTSDETLITRVSGLLNAIARVRAISEPLELESNLAKHDPVLILFDLRAQDTENLLPTILKTAPSSLVMAFGMKRSLPAIEVEAMGVYSVEDFNVERRRLQALVRHALEHLALVRENKFLRDDHLSEENRNMPTQEPEAPPHSLALHHLSNAFRHFDDQDTMLANMADGIASSTRVSRVGIFAYDYENEVYTFRAGVKCMGDIRNVIVKSQDPFVQWMRIHAHLIVRQNLHLISTPGERSFLQNTLETMGAEVIVPLHGHDNIIGWIFFGHHLTGAPYSLSDLEELMQLGEHVAVTLENQQLYEKVAIQKVLADTVFDSMPVGIVAVDTTCRLRWLNTAAREILEVEKKDIAKQSVATLSSRLADLLARRIQGDQDQEEPYEWRETKSKRTLSVLTRKLQSGSKCIGALAIVRDMTQEYAIRKKEEEYERATFWSELAAAMSHEVRNPLVAISTFAQLLQDRYDDPDFREKFSELVKSEISRLNGMVDQISDFAEKPQLNFEPLFISDIVHKAVANRIKATGISPSIIELSIEDNLPKIMVDKSAMLDGISHLITNAIEATKDVKYPSIHLILNRVNAPGKKEDIRFIIMDNGKGISPDDIQKVFSPFYTTKARGIGLGLPIARRTVIDHGGHIFINASDKGTSIEITLPILSPQDIQHNHSLTNCTV